MSDDNTKPLPEFNPCPFCGHHHITTPLKRSNFSVHYTNQDKNWWYVRCNNCRGTGPIYSYEDGAVEAWNTRAPLYIIGEATTEEMGAEFERPSEPTKPQIEAAAQALAGSGNCMLFCAEPGDEAKSEWMRLAKAALIAASEVG